MISSEIAGVAPQTQQRALIPRPLTLEDDTVERLFHYLEQTRPSMALIKEVVCEFYCVERYEIEGNYRSAAVVFARHVFCYFAHKYNRASLRQIGLRVGYADHTTPRHAVRRIAGYAVTRPLVRDDLDLLRLRLCEKILLRGRGSRC